MLKNSDDVKTAVFFEKMRMIRYKINTQKLIKQALVKLP